MYPVASHHAFQVIINIPLVQIFKNSRKPSFPAPQELEIISELEDNGNAQIILSRNIDCIRKREEKYHYRNACSVFFESARDLRIFIDKRENKPYKKKEKQKTPWTHTQRTTTTRDYPVRRTHENYCKSKQ
jgi:hypothetical protein